MSKQLKFEFSEAMRNYPCADIIENRRGKKQEEKSLEKMKLPEQIDSKYFGIRREDLERLSQEAIGNLFYGVHNLNVLVKMLEIENPDETIANYYRRIGKIYRYFKHRYEAR